MSEIKIAFYDDEPYKLTSWINWLDSLPGCELKVYSQAQDLVRDVIEGYRPTIGIIDLNGSLDLPPQNLINALDDAKDCGLDSYQHLAHPLLRERHLESWERDRYYGIGLLALLKAAGCPLRTAHSFYTSSRGYLVEILYECDLITEGGNCPKEEPSVKRQITEMIEKARQMNQQ